MVLMTDASKPEEGGEKPIGCPCDSCKLARFDPTHKLKNAVVHSWNFKPRPWRLKSVENDPFPYYLGVELETDSHWSRPMTRAEQRRHDNNRRYYEDRMTTIEYPSNVSKRVAADMRRPKQLWVAKNDSSVSGPEFASHPATLTYWRSKEQELRKMFEMLLHAGYRSHDNDQCGMHINISRTAFDGANHLYRFLTLLHYSPAWSLRMSQRTKASMQHWAPLGTGEMRIAKLRKQQCRTTFSQRWGATTEKYAALNMPSASQGRFEFRLPRGTLRIDRFFKNLEWTVAMIEYSRTSKVSTSRPIPFMKYVMDNRDKYPYLAAFITERNAKLEKAVYRPRKPRTAGTPRRPSRPAMDYNRLTQGELDAMFPNHGALYVNDDGQVRGININTSTWEQAS